ncbi:hypothetical protein [Alicyclobacillus fodiniaquatilis]|uniref:DUF4412 domain-containing protein n=1 Tax=Alicyclobacillus fodiniaquatilis TaxID=1661150 RepID=A0ABW4JMN2_9BACL
MNKGYKFAIGGIAAAALAGITLTSTVFAGSTMPQTKMHAMPSKITVSKVYPVNTAQVDLMAKNTMSLKGKTITLQAMNTMGTKMSKSKSTMMAKYNAMKKGFVLNNGKMLTPGVTYKVKANWAKLSMSSFTIPNLLSVQQVGKNRLLVVYDQKVDPMSATTPSNYWIQSNQAMASGIAELGMNDKMTSMNGLTKSDVTITKDGMSGMKYFFTFSSNITPGVKYTFMPCNVDAPGLSMYAGANFNSDSANSFVGNTSGM